MGMALRAKGCKSSKPEAAARFRARCCGSGDLTEPQRRTAEQVAHLPSRYKTFGLSRQTAQVRAEANPCPRRRVQRGIEGSCVDRRNGANPPVANAAVSHPTNRVLVASCLAPKCCIGPCLGARGQIRHLSQYHVRDIVAGHFNKSRASHCSGAPGHATQSWTGFGVHADLTCAHHR